MADDDPGTTKRSKRDDDEILRLSRERFKLAVDAEHDLRIAGKEDDEFRSGQHWPADIKLQRSQDGRPCLTIDKLSQPIRQVTSRERQSRPAIQINPVSGGADQQTADIQQGLIRQIESASYADIAYDWAFDGAVSRGWGYVRILTDYETPDSFDQILKIEWVENPYTVYMDPTARLWNGSDAKCGHIVQDFTPEEFDFRFGKDKARSSLEAYSSLGDQAPTWFPGDKIRVAEYFYDEPETYTLVQMSDGTTGDKAALPKRLPRGVKIVSERAATRHQIRWCLHDATQILERRDWAGKFIPIVRVEGERLNIDGKRILRGLIRTSRDPQRMYDYWLSTATETTALAPRAPYVMYEGQDEGYEAMWQQANIKAFSSLKVRAQTKQTGNQILPLPQRQSVEPPIQAMMAGVSQAEQDIRSITGFYDATDPRRANTEQSGRAILTRQQQGAETNGNFIDNLGRSLRYVGEILLDLLPKIYDRPGRVVQIVGLDDEVKEVMLNQPFQKGPDGKPQAMQQGPPGAPPQGPPQGGPPQQGPPQPGQPPAANPMQPIKEGMQQFYDLNKGHYSVTVSIGASYATRRQEAVASMLELIRATPEVAPMISDVLVKNMDWPGAPALADRLKKMLPPQLQDGQQGPDPQQLQQQLQALGQQHEMLTKALEEQTEFIKSDKAANESKERIAVENNRSKELIAGLQAKTQMLISAEKLSAQQNMAGLNADIQRIISMMELAHDRMEQTQDLAFEAQSRQTEAPTPPVTPPQDEAGEASAPTEEPAPV